MFKSKILSSLLLATALFSTSVLAKEPNMQAPVNVICTTNDIAEDITIKVNKGTVVFMERKAIQAKVSQSYYHKGLLVVKFAHLINKGKLVEYVSVTFRKGQIQVHRAAMAKTGLLGTQQFINDTYRCFNVI
jgi:hypothetical protein